MIVGLGFDDGLGLLAPRAGVEPATLRLTVECSTAELPRNRRRKMGRGRDQKILPLASCNEPAMETVKRRTQYQFPPHASQRLPRYTPQGFAPRGTSARSAVDAGGEAGNLGNRNPGRICAGPGSP